MIVSDQVSPTPKDPAIRNYLYGLEGGEGLGRGSAVIRAHIALNGPESILCEQLDGPAVRITIRRKVQEHEQSDNRLKQETTSDVRPGATREIALLIRTLFSAPELEHFVHVYFSELRPSIDFNQSLSHIAHDIALTLTRHGLLGEEFFDHLIEIRPNARDTIDSARKALSRERRLSDGQVESSVESVGLKSLKDILDDIPEIVGVLEQALGGHGGDESTSILEALESVPPEALTNSLFIRQYLNFGIEASISPDVLRNVYLAVLTHHPRIGLRPEVRGNVLDFSELDLASVELEIARRQGRRSQLLFYKAGLRGPGAIYDPAPYGLETSHDSRAQRAEEVVRTFARLAWRHIDLDGEPDVEDLKVALQDQQDALEHARRTGNYGLLNASPYYVSHADLSDDVVQAISREFGIEVARCRSELMTATSPGKKIEYALRTLDKEIALRKAPS